MNSHDDGEPEQERHHPRHQRAHRDEPLPPLRRQRHQRHQPGEAGEEHDVGRRDLDAAGRQAGLHRQHGDCDRRGPPGVQRQQSDEGCADYDDCLPLRGDDEVADDRGVPGCRNCPAA
jgi:hypothetical protein